MLYINLDCLIFYLGKLCFENLESGMELTSLLNSFSTLEHPESTTNIIMKYFSFTLFYKLFDIGPILLITLIAQI